MTSFKTNITQITSLGISKALEKYDYSRAIAEYVWNGFDAGASQVAIDVTESMEGAISSLKISDNGHGILGEERFQSFFQSDQIINQIAGRKKSSLRSKKGIGRLTFFHFAYSARWETVHEKEGKKYKYSISIERASLNSYQSSEPEEVSDTEPTGTLAIFHHIYKIKIDNFKTDIREFLCQEFAWFLELNCQRNFSLKINGEDLNYESWLIEEREEAQHMIKSYSFNIKFIHWKKRLNQEYSKYYLIDSQGNEKDVDTTTLNNRGDRFFHSIFVQSAFFEKYQPSAYRIDIEAEKIHEELKKFLEKLLKDKRKKFLQAASDQIVEKFEKDGIFPRFSDDPWNRIRRSELSEFIKELYQVEPKIFVSLNTEQKKVFVNFLNLIMDSEGRDHLIDVIGSIVTLDQSEIEQLAKSLKTSKMSNVIRTIKLIEDRYRAIDELKNLVFNLDFRANERDHLQKFVESHYWIFGEQYHLVTAAEPKFEEALRRHYYHLTGEKTDASINHPDKNKEMDIFMVRQLSKDDQISNVVIELKHPTKKLGPDELMQVKKYMRVIVNQPQFNASNMFWTYYLVGNDFDYFGYIDGELESAKSHGEKSLVHSNKTHKIYVKRWSEIFTEFDLRHKFLYEKLELEKAKLITTASSADEIINNLQSNSAVQPPQITIPRD